MRLTDLWKDRNNDKVKKEAYSKLAEDFAIELGKRGRKNKRTQIMKFYDEVLRLETEAKRDPDKNWDLVLPRLNMLVAKAVYAEGRELVSEDFSRFIRNSIEDISELKDLELFSNFFEALMGFYRKYGPKN